MLSTRPVDEKTSLQGKDTTSAGAVREKEPVRDYAFNKGFSTEKRGRENVGELNAVD